jgi:hypothetical protein
MTTYIDALQAVGRDADARKLAEEKYDHLDFAMDRSWWVLSYHACTRAQLGRFEDALVLLDRIKELQGLPVMPLLQDSLCFRPLQGDPRYRGLLAHLEARKKALAERLPMTLLEYGVADVRARPRAPR